MILHGNHRGFNVERAVRITQTKRIRELERRVAGKQYFAGRAEFDDDAFGEIRACGCFAELKSTGQLYRDSYGSRFREKAGKSSHCAGVLRRSCCGCGLMRQAINRSEERRVGKEGRSR